MKTKNLFTVLSVLSPMVLTSLFAVNVIAGPQEKQIKTQVTATLPNGEVIDFFKPHTNLDRLKADDSAVAIISKSEVDASLKESMKETMLQAKIDLKKSIEESNALAIEQSMKEQTPQISRTPGVVTEVKREIALDAKSDTNEEINNIDQSLVEKSDVQLTESQIADQIVEKEGITVQTRAGNTVSTAQLSLSLDRSIEDKPEQVAKEKTEEQAEQVAKEEAEEQTEQVADSNKEIQELLDDSDDLADGAMNLHEKSHSSKSKKRRDLILKKIEAAEDVLADLEEKASELEKTDSNSNDLDSIAEKLEVVKDELANARITLEERNERDENKAERKRLASKVIELDKANCEYRNQPNTNADYFAKFQEHMLGQMSQNMQMLRMMQMIPGLAQTGPKVEDILGSDPLTRMMLEMRYGLGNNTNGYSPLGYDQRMQPTINVFGNYYNNPLDGYQFPGQRDDFARYAPMSIDNSQEGFNMTAPRYFGNASNFSQMNSQNTRRGVSNHSSVGVGPLI